MYKNARPIIFLPSLTSNFINSDDLADLDIFIIGKISDVGDLEDLYNIKINLIKSDKNKFDKREPLIAEIIKNHIVLKGVEEFIKLLW